MNTPEQLLSRLIVPRLEDLPYWTSPPIQFVYESAQAVVAGSYDWADPANPLTPNRPLLDNALYFFRSISLAADIAEQDYEANIVSAFVPQFQMYLASDAKAVLFREPIVMNKYYQNFDYRFLWSAARGANQLFASFVGTMAQGPSLVGKGSITLKAIISAQEIVDEHFIELFRHASYPHAKEGN
jgi:hypothetical protein